MKIRAHHGLCTRNFVGEGYSDDFSVNMKRVIDKLNNENPEVTIVARLDDICAKCPENLGEVCQSQDKVVSYDKKVLQMTGIEEETSMPWRDFYDACSDKIFNKSKRTEICGACQWNELCLEVENKGK
jgi:hypothetical protein